jgi:hypothetical protein
MASDIETRIESYIITNNLTHINNVDKESVTELIKKQYKECPIILKELNDNGEKKSCWTWYIFPTDQIGRCDGLKTRVTIDTVQILLKFAPDGANGWRSCLEKIIELAIQNKNLAIQKQNNLEYVLPRVDIGRVEFFIKFWKKIDDKPQWLTNVCEDLENIYKGNTPIKRQSTSTSTSTKYLLLLIEKHYDKLNSMKNNY